MIDEQQTLAIYLSATQFDAALHMIADLIDLKSPYTFGHSRAVAKLAAAAGELLGTDIDDVDQLYRAGLVHDLGRLGISNAIWHKRGVLTPSRAREVRHLSPAVCAHPRRAAPALRELGELAGMHRERIDGSGYPAGLAGRRIPHDARVLAAADAYQSMREARPHRVAFTREEAAIRMRAEARAGHLDARAAAAQYSPRWRRRSPRGRSTAPRPDHGGTRRAAAARAWHASPRDRARTHGRAAQDRAPGANDVREDEYVRSGDREPVRDVARPRHGLSRR